MSTKRKQECLLADGCPQKQMIAKWEMEMTKKDKINFQKALASNENWFKEDQIQNLDKIVQTDPIFRKLIASLPLPFNIENRPCYKYQESNGICGDDVQYRYIYVKHKMEEVETEKKNIYLDHLIQQEKLRFETVQYLHKYNQKLQTIQAEMKRNGMDSDFKKIGYFRLFPEDVNRHDDLDYPLGSFHFHSCGGPAELLELAFDIVRLGSLEKVQQTMDLYYRAKHAVDF